MDRRAQQCLLHYARRKRSNEATAVPPRVCGMMLISRIVAPGRSTWWSLMSEVAPRGLKFYCCPNDVVERSPAIRRPADDILLRALDVGLDEAHPRAVLSDVISTSASSSNGNQVSSGGAPRCLVRRNDSFAHFRSPYPEPPAGRDSVWSSRPLEPVVE